MGKGWRMAAPLTAVLLFASPALADEIISLKAGYMMLSPSGELAAEVDGLGTKVDLDSDLGLDDSEDIMAEAALSLGDMKLSLGYMPLSFEGNSVLSRSILFNGEVYTVDSPISSSLELDILDAGLTYYFLNIDDMPTRVQLGVELAVKVTDASASLTDQTTGITESAGETLPLPTVGLRARVAFSDFIGVSGRLGYLGYSDNHFLDADVQVEFSPLPMVGVFAGYRHIDIAIDESDIFVDSDFSGFYGGALVRFNPPVCRYFLFRTYGAGQFSDQPHC